MADIPLSSEEKAQLGDFLFKLLQGKAELGWSSMGMIALYDRARKAGQDLGSILAASPTALTWVANLLHAHASRIPVSALSVLELVVKAAKQPPIPPKPPAAPQSAASPTGGLDDDV